MKTLTLFMLSSLVMTDHSFAQTNTLPTSGDVGIGTTNPLHQLHLYSQTDYNQFVIESGIINGYANFWVKGIGHTYQIGTASSSESAFGVANKFFVFDRDNLAMRFIISTNGNVGIGTVNPVEKLTVNGTIASSKMKVTQSIWPDFVFHSSYHLPTLHDVETFIQQNKHLPDVPSAEKIEKEGLDVGGNQAILLKKIEELTLYVIEQNKKLTEQQKQIDLLKQTISNRLGLPRKKL